MALKAPVKGGVPAPSLLKGLGLEVDIEYGLSKLVEEEEAVRLT